MLYYLSKTIVVKTGKHSHDQILSFKVDDSTYMQPRTLSSRRFRTQKSEYHNSNRCLAILTSGSI